LFNTLLQRERAITSHIPGTTRDYIEETLILNGISVKLIDTAGIRETEDIIELEGIRLVNSVIEQSNMILVINDITISPYNSDKLLNSLKKKYPEKVIFLINNKIDKIKDNFNLTNFEAVYISAKKNIGIDQLKQRIEKATLESTERILDILINQRHALLLNRAIDELQNALHAVNDNYENEFIAIDIRRAIKTLGEITGESWDDEILNNIFSKFCIGK
jgi:tRNA modification GTPase